MKGLASELLKEGYKPRDISEAFSISRTNCYAKEEVSANKEENVDDVHIVEHIKAIIGEHPYWGYRRITAWIKKVEKHLVNRKKIYRLMKENNILVPQRIHKAKRTPQKTKPQATKPRQYWGIDMTKFMVTFAGWVYLVIVLDWFTKKIVGYSISPRCRSSEWKEAIEMAIQNECPKGSRAEDIALISDNGSQPTSTSFMEEMATLGIKQIFTSYNNPKGNADTERSIRTIKEEIIWINEIKTLEESKEKIISWIENDYNKMYPHSSLNYLSPCEFEAAYVKAVDDSQVETMCNEEFQVSENGQVLNHYQGRDIACMGFLGGNFEDETVSKTEIWENLDKNGVYENEKILV